ncbi:type II toxin-antitoxin system RelE/ParE family toxin [Azospirillum sp. B4]|uniref:type II toxin-antitoxin system RelE/ParE family toxin n=1 Tax=Azospirillum sp. B4 TaxID=95605 RepID=UPI0003451311|nr:type II toxin-antitoxin system RelE/ParE family toxin [Azospirillum sp. B4]
MAKVVFSPLSKEDLHEIWAHIYAENPKAADDVIDAVFDFAEKLAEFPKLGRDLGEIAAGLRSFSVHKSYVVLYRLTGRAVEIVRVLHGRRDFDAIFTQITD